MLDIFKKDAFNTLSLTQAVNKLPYIPSRIGAMGLFQKKGISSLQVAVEEQQGKIQLLMTAARGTMPYTLSKGTRNIRSFLVPHIPINDAVLADEVQGVRSFGSEDQIESVATIVNEKLAQMRQNMELTHEWHRMGALKGTVLDGDASTVLFNYFTEFGITQSTVDFDFTPAAQDMKTKALAVIRLIENALGLTPYDHVHAFCGETFYDSLVAHANVTKSYELFQTNAFARQQQREPFVWGDITWEHYRGSIGGTPFIAATEAVFFPVGVPGLFIEHYAPANFMETVNTIGKAMYAKQEPMKFDTGVELHTQSNPLMMCTRPSVIIKGF